MDLARRGEYIDPSKDTVSDFLNRWETWAATQVAAKTLERYSGLLRHHVRPHLAASRLQKLKAIHLAELYGNSRSRKAQDWRLVPSMSIASFTALKGMLLSGARSELIPPTRQSRHA